jgi:hypothetical protein
MSKSQANMTITTEVLAAFKKHCADAGMKMSSRIELLMKADMQTDHPVYAQDGTLQRTENG